MMHEEDAKDARYTYIETNPIYSSNVLTGHWRQARFDGLPENNSAIVPCVLVDSLKGKGCEQHLTTSQEAYSVAGFDQNEITRFYKEAGTVNFSNFKAQRSSIKFLDAEKFGYNYTSMNHLAYELWPKILQGEIKLPSKSDQESSKKHKPALRLDSLDAFGNHSSMKRHICIPPLCPVPTTYKLQFTGRTSSRRQPVKNPDTIDRLA